MYRANLLLPAEKHYREIARIRQISEEGPQRNTSISKYPLETENNFHSQGNKECFCSNNNIGKCMCCQKLMEMPIAAKEIKQEVIENNSSNHASNDEDHFDVFDID